MHPCFIEKGSGTSGDRKDTSAWLDRSERGHVWQRGEVRGRDSSVPTLRRLGGQEQVPPHTAASGQETVPQDKP